MRQSKKAATREATPPYYERDESTGDVTKVVVGEWMWEAKGEWADDPTLHFRGGSIALGDSLEDLRQIAADLDALIRIRVMYSPKTTPATVAGS
jgi:hypothetical protein